MKKLIAVLAALAAAFAAALYWLGKSSHRR